MFAVQEDELSPAEEVDSGSGQELDRQTAARLGRGHSPGYH